MLMAGAQLAVQKHSSANKEVAGRAIASEFVGRRANFGYLDDRPKKRTKWAPSISDASKRGKI